MTIDYVMSTEQVDWTALKRALAADDFDNGRTPDQYRRSHELSHATVLAYDDGQIVGNGRILSDGVCNAYLVDIWTRTDHRRRGIGAEIVRRLTETVPGQHVGLFTDDRQDFYTALGFRVRPDFMERVQATWLANG